MIIITVHHHFLVSVVTKGHNSGKPYNLEDTKNWDEQSTITDLND